MARLRRLISRLYRAVFFSELPRMLPTRILARAADESLRLRHSIQEIIRQRVARQSPAVDPAIRSVNGKILTRSILESDVPWRNVKDPAVTIPGMLTPVERQYYVFITKFYSGFGEVVELGPWLGLSTSVLLCGLRRNRYFNGKIHVYDDFVWRGEWMNKWLDGTDIAPPQEHESFQSHFEACVGADVRDLVVQRGKLCNNDGNEGLAEIEWTGRPIELMIVDCGRYFLVNESWWDTFHRFFVRDKTLIVMQDWQNYKRVPEVWWENTKIFTDSKQHRLDLIHEVAGGCIATFVYR